MIAFFYLVLIVLPLGARSLFGSVIPGSHEYESLFIYGSDILLLLYLLGVFFTAHKPTHNIHEKSFRLLFAPLYIFIIAAFISTYVAPSYALSFYGFLRLLLLIAFALTIPIMMRQVGVFRKTVILLSVLAVIQAGIGIYQFSAQADLGLQVLGEPNLVTYMGSASTVAAEGGRVLRSYGTFSHPNIFGAFLLLGLLSLCYLYVHEDNLLYQWDAKQSVCKNFKRFLTSRHFYTRILMSASFFVILLALAMTLSRGAWLGALAALVTFLIIGSLHGYLRASLRLLAVLVATGAVIIYVLYPVLAPRSQVHMGQPAVEYRLSYNRIATDLMRTNPFGVGLGNQVLYSVQSRTYQDAGLTKVYEWEPVHNLYLLIASEIGTVGLLSFLAFLVILVWHAIKHSVSLPEIAVLGLLVGFLVLGLFDHYLWTIQPGRLMLWLVIGLALSHFKIERT